MSLSFVIVGSQIKRFKTVVKSLAAIGSELLVEGLPEKLILRAINSAHSAFLAVSLSAQFFESYNVFAQRGVVQAGVTIKHLLATFRSVRVSSMSFDLNEQQAALRVSLRCDNGLLKQYGLDLNRSEILQANLDSQSLPVAVVAEAAELNKLLNTFQSTLDEVSIIALPEPPAGGDTQGEAAAQRCVRLQSFYDPAKAAGAKSLHTSMSLDACHVFKSYANAAAAPCDVTINLKDLKALVGLCAELGADVVLRFDEAGVPLLASPHVPPGVQYMDYTAELILSTLQESVHREDEDQPAWQQQQQQAAPQQQPPQANGAAAAAAAAAAGGGGGADGQQQRAETIFAATSAGNGAAAGVLGPGAAETPQGGGPPGPGNGAARWQPQPAAAAAAAAAAGGGISGGGGVSGGRISGGAGSGGGRSGGRSARSGGASRFEQLEAALAAEAAQQQQQQEWQQRQWQQQQGQHQQQQEQRQQQQQGTAPGYAAAASGGGVTYNASPDDLDALPGRRRLSRSPAPAAAAAAVLTAGAVTAGQQQQQHYQQQWRAQQQQQEEQQQQQHPEQQWHQQQQQQHPEWLPPQQQQQPPQQLGVAGDDAAAYVDVGGDGMDEQYDDEELAATPPEEGADGMQAEGLGYL